MTCADVPRPAAGRDAERMTKRSPSCPTSPVGGVVAGMLIMIGFVLALAVKMDTMIKLIQNARA
jgi:hypothetical protein